jgi:hypothetical protein
MFFAICGVEGADSEDSIIGGSTPSFIENLPASNAAMASFIEGTSGKVISGCLVFSEGKAVCPADSSAGDCGVADGALIWLFKKLECEILPCRSQKVKG